MAYHRTRIDSRVTQKKKLKENTLRYIVTAFNPIASVVLSSGHRWKFAIRWRNVAKLITHVTTIAFHGRVSSRSLIIDDII